MPPRTRAETRRQVDPLAADPTLEPDELEDPPQDPNQAGVQDQDGAEPVEPEPVEEDPAEEDLLEEDLVVVIDLASWQVRLDGRLHVERAGLGEVLTDLPAPARERLLRFGAAVPASVAQAVLAERALGAPAVPTGPYGDAELAGRSPAELVAYVTQHPSEAARVNQIERARSLELGQPARSVVLSATGLNHDGVAYDGTPAY